MWSPCFTNDKHTIHEILPRPSRLTFAFLDVLSILGGQKVFLGRCGLESRAVAPKHDRSRLVAHTWMSVVLTPMSVKVKTASKIRRDPARRRPAPTPERATA